MVSFRITNRHLPPAHDWEKPAILATEEGFTLIRQFNDQLMQMRRLSLKQSTFAGSPDPAP